MTTDVTAERPQLSALVRATIVAGLVAAFTSDFELYLTTVLPVHGSLAAVYRFIADVACGGAHPPFDPVIFGLLAHIGISLGWAYGYVDLAGRNTAVRDAPWISGTVFGIVVLIAMQCILLGVHRFTTFTPVAFVNVFVMHTLFFGVPIALVAHRMLTRRA